MSLGKDLASIRKSQNLTLEDIQNAVKIPLDTLKSIENESIFSDSTKNKTYVRSFVRSYAKVLKIDDKDIVQALDEVEEGAYKGRLLGDSSEESEDSDFTLEPRDTLISEHSKETEEPAPEPGKPKQNPLAPTQDDSINWADMGRKFTTVSKNSKMWLFVSIFALIVVLGGGTGYYFWDDISSLFESDDVPNETTTSAVNNDEQNAVPPTPVDSSAVTQNNDTEVAEEPEANNQQNRSPIQLGDTLTVSVYAAYGQLEPVRITSDLNWRTNPFWMEEGESYYFDFQDTLLVRGQYSRMLLLFNGHVIENPRQNYFDSAFNSIMITRESLDQPRYLAPPPEEFPLNVAPPDSTVYRIRF